MSILPFLAGALALALALALHPGPAALALAGPALGAALLPVPRRALVLAISAAFLLLAGPALAQATAAPAPSWGLWAALGPTVDGAAEWIIGAALSALSGLVYLVSRHAIPALVEARLRQTMLTGAHLVVLEVEQRIEAAWTPARRKAAVDAIVEHAMDRMPWAVARLKLTQRAVSGMALKMLDQVIAGRGAVTVAVPGAPLSLVGLAGNLLGAGLPDAAPQAMAADTPCSTCGAADPERMSRGCVRDGCPKVPADAASSLSDPLAAAAAGYRTLLGAGLLPG